MVPQAFPKRDFLPSSDCLADLRSGLALGVPNACCFALCQPKNCSAQMQPDNLHAVENQGTLVISMRLLPAWNSKDTLINFLLWPSPSGVFMYLCYRWMDDGHKTDRAKYHVILHISCPEWPLTALCTLTSSQVERANQSA